MRAFSPVPLDSLFPLPLISQSPIHTDFDKFVMESNSFAELRRATFQDGCNIPARTVDNLSMDDTRRKRQAKEKRGDREWEKGIMYAHDAMPTLLDPHANAVFNHIRIRQRVASSRQERGGEKASARGRLRTPA